MQSLFEISKLKGMLPFLARTKRAIAPIMCAAVMALNPISVDAANTAEENQAGAIQVAAALKAEFPPHYDIQVTYQDGNVWLYGELMSQVEVNHAVAMVKKLNGVQNVHNGLSVKEYPVELEFPLTVRESAIPKPGAPVAPSPQITRPIRQVSANGRNAQPIQHAYPSRGTLENSRVVAIHNSNVSPGNRALPAAYIQNGQVVPVNYQEYLSQSPAMGHQAIPGQYNQPNLPNHAWPSYAAYPNYAQVTYPKQYSRKAWPYIGPYYPYPKVPLEWRKVTMEFHDGWWWLDFDDGSNKGPFSPLFREYKNYR